MNIDATDPFEAAAMATRDLATQIHEQCMKYRDATMKASNGLFDREMCNAVVRASLIGAVGLVFCSNIQEFNPSIPDEVVGKIGQTLTDRIDGIVKDAFLEMGAKVITRDVNVAPEKGGEEPTKPEKG